VLQILASAPCFGTLSSLPDRFVASARLLFAVTTGLDPVVHAEPPNERRGRIDRRVKPGNDDNLGNVPSSEPPSATLREEVNSLSERRYPKLARDAVEHVAETLRHRDAVGAAVEKLGVALLAGQPDALDAGQAR
jgi:hypothetical protein